MQSRFESSSFVLATLVVTQLISLMSILAWGAIASVLLRANQGLDTAGAFFTFYPVPPVAFSVLAWFAFKLRKYKPALFLSTVPALLAFVLMVYYYIVGVMN